MPCAASHRLKGSVSCARMSKDSSVVSAGVSVNVTGAEKFRSNDGTGGTPPNKSVSDDFLGVNVNLARMADSTRVVASVASSSATTLPKPTAPNSSETVISKRDKSKSNPVWPCNKPTLIGTSCASFSLRPCSSGVLGRTCLKLSEYVSVSSSNSLTHVTTGVPAWWYQFAIPVMSVPGFASRIAAKKSSQVTACPSCRAK
mmetsp:Transcript_7579/g.28459  ORF Transcript_7579/g.28459 Transcript_7579/m.28459 type:complete len:201 (-) Transcript_7579:280-882(-)